MSAITFSTKEGKAFYYNSIPDFITENSNNIIAELIKHSFELNIEQRDAWENQINELKNKLSTCGMSGDIIFEYDIVRLGKRIDVILLIRHMVFSLEFKNGKKIYSAVDARQAEDYAVDIKNFHKESEDLYVCPILIATNATKIEGQSLDYFPDKQIKLQKENSETFIDKVKKLRIFMETIKVLILKNGLIHLIIQHQQLLMRLYKPIRSIILPKLHILKHVKKTLINVKIL